MQDNAVFFSLLFSLALSRLVILKSRRLSGPFSLSLSLLPPSRFIYGRGVIPWVLLPSLVRLRCRREAVAVRVAGHGEFRQ